MQALRILPTEGNEICTFTLIAPLFQGVSLSVDDLSPLLRFVSYYSQGNTASQISESASVRNASRRLSDSRAGVRPMAGRGAGEFGSIHPFPDLIGAD